MIRPEAVWKLETSAPVTYTDCSNYIRSNTAFTFIEANTQYFYVGSDRRYTGIYIDLSTNGSYTSVSYSYYDGTEWKTLSLIDSYSFSESKYVRWVMPDPWQKHELSEEGALDDTFPDKTERYWIKITVSTVTTAAVISKIRVVPYATYSSPTKVSQLMQLRKDFDHSTTPSDLAVEDMIRRAEDRIDYRTRKSWRFNAVTEDYDPVLVDYNRYGFFMRHRDFRKVYSVKMWNGGDFQTLTEGRNNDYFVNFNLGMIYLTRLFLLPAAYGVTGRYFLFGYGEYKNSIKVDYVYGRDPEVDREFFIVEDIATKMAAIDILKHHDYSALMVSGSDKVDLASKVSILAEEVETRLEELGGLTLV